jgi:NAD(P)H-hydrate repair Nnr-like enzyme with NAD(P)H-hydrate dehydratase domain
LQESFGGQWVLKGAGTLILESKKIWINNLNMPQLGTAGSGDMLTGFIAGAWSLGSISPARTGVWLHSFYAQKALRRKVTPFLTATDLLN